MLTSMYLGSHLPSPSRGRWWGAAFPGGSGASPVWRLAVHAPDTPAGLAYRANTAAWRVARVTDPDGKKYRLIAWSDDFAAAIMLVALTLVALAAIMVTRALGYNGVGVFFVVLAAAAAASWAVERLMVARVDSVTAAAKTRFLTAVTGEERMSLRNLADALDDLERWHAAGRLTRDEWAECRLYVWRLADTPMLVSRDRRYEVLSWLRSVAERAYRRDEPVTAGAPARWW